MKRRILLRAKCMHHLHPNRRWMSMLHRWSRSLRRIVRTVSESNNATGNSASSDIHKDINALDSSAKILPTNKRAHAVTSLTRTPAPIPSQSI